MKHYNLIEVAPSTKEETFVEHLECQDLEDFKKKDNKIIFPHFHQQGCMNDQFEDCKKGIGLPGDPRRTLKEDDIVRTLPIINLLEPLTIRSVGAFNRCVYAYD